MKPNLRMLRGKEIYNSLGQIKKLYEGIYLVKSQSRHGNYTVTETPHGWVCQCPGKTPSEACGLKVNGANKWMTLIQNASRHPKPQK